MISCRRAARFALVHSCIGAFSTAAWFALVHFCIGAFSTAALSAETIDRVLAIVAGILVARHLKTADDLFDSKPSPRTESMVAAAVQWAERALELAREGDRPAYQGHLESYRRGQPWRDG